MALAACGSTSSPEQAPAPGSCAEAQQIFGANSYSPSLSEVEIAANIAVQRPSCFDQRTRVAAQAWLDWWHQPHPSDGTFTGLGGPRFPA